MISYSFRVPMYYSFPSRYSDAYRIELDAFLDCINGYGELTVSGKMTQAVSKIATACDQSARLVGLLNVVICGCNDSNEKSS